MHIKIPITTNSYEVFPDEETFQEIFSKCLEDHPAPTSESVKIIYQEMNDAFIKYLEAIQENTFRYAYQCGFRAALDSDIINNG